MLEIPTDVTVLEMLQADGATFETSKQGDRITSITWRKAIPPKTSAEFAFRARNPAATEIAWKAHQHFSDGTVADWIGPAGAGRPASVTKLSSSAAGARSNDAAAVETRLNSYDAAFNAKDGPRQARDVLPPTTPAIGTSSCLPTTVHADRARLRTSVADPSGAGGRRGEILSVDTRRSVED